MGTVVRLICLPRPPTGGVLAKLRRGSRTVSDTFAPAHPNSTAAPAKVPTDTEPD